MNVLKKGIVCLSMAGLMLFSCSMHAYANESVEIVIGNTEGDVGDRIQIPISLKNSAEVGGMDFSVVYDSQELKYVKAQKGSSAKVANLCDILHHPEQSSIRYVYASLNPMSEDGEILVITFEVLKEMETSHTVSVTVKDVLDLEIQELPYTVSGGRAIEPSDAGISEEDTENDGELTVNLEKNESDAADSVMTEKESSSEETKEETTTEIKVSDKIEEINQTDIRYGYAFLIIVVLAIVFIFAKRLSHKKDDEK